MSTDKKMESKKKQLDKLEKQLKEKSDRLEKQRVDGEKYSEIDSKIKDYKEKLTSINSELTPKKRKKKEKVQDDGY